MDFVGRTNLPCVPHATHGQRVGKPCCKSRVKKKKDAKGNEPQIF